MILCTPEGTRTPNPRLRRATLDPVELQARYVPLAGVEPVIIRVEISHSIH